MPTGWPPALLRQARGVHRRVIHPLLSFLLPAECFGCAAPLPAVQCLGACGACWTGLSVLEPPLCSGCALPRRVATDLLGPVGGRCASCILQPPATDRALAAVVYDDLARAFLLRAKHGGRRELLAPLGLQLARLVESRDLALGCSSIVAAPSHPWMTLKRGFAPAALLARRVARHLGLPWLPGTLARSFASGLTARSLGARKRRARLTGMLRVRRRVTGQRLLLIDDVMTTGATVDACARVLKAAGALEVRVATWARAMPRS